MYRFRAGVVVVVLAATFSSPFIVSAQVGAESGFNQFSGGCHQITAEEIAGLKAMGATIPSNGLFCDKDKPLLYGGCSESPYPYLKTKDRTGRADSISGLNSDFACRMMKFFKAADAAGQNVAITSAYRSEALQKVLYDKYIACGRCGAPVAPPGKSKHGFGLAIDLWMNGQKIPTNTAQCIANNPVCKWVHANYSQYGLRFPMEYEPWHIEPSGAVNGRQQPLPEGGWQSDDTGSRYTNTSSQYSPSMWNPSMAPTPQMFSPLGSTGAPSPTGSTVPSQTGSTGSTGQTYDPNAYLPTNYNSIPLPTASSSIFTVPPPYVYPLSTSLTTGTQTNNYYDRLNMLASTSQSTGASTATGGSTNTGSSTQLNDNLFDIDNGTSNTGGANLDDNRPIVISTTSVAINPIHVTQTFSGSQPQPVATTSLKANQNQSLIITLLTAVRDLLVSYLKFLKAQPTYGFQGAWKPAQSGALYR